MIARIRIKRGTHGEWGGRCPSHGLFLARDFSEAISMAHSHLRAAHPTPRSSGAA